MKIGGVDVLMNEKKKGGVRVKNGGEALKELKMVSGKVVMLNAMKEKGYKVMEQ